MEAFGALYAGTSGDLGQPASLGWQCNAQGKLEEAEIGDLMRDWEGTWQRRGCSATERWPWLGDSTLRIVSSAVWNMPFLMMDWDLGLLRPPGGDAPTVATLPVANFACWQHPAMVDPAVQGQNTGGSSSAQASDLSEPKQPEEG